MSLVTTMDLRFTGRQVGTHDTGAIYKDHIVNYLQTLTSGTADGSADLIWSDVRTLATTTEDLDIRGGLTDALGATLAVVELVGLIFWHKGSTGTLTIGGDSAPVGIFADASDKIVIQPGGLFIWFAPNAGVSVGAASTDVIQVQSSSSVEYLVVVIGRSS